MSDSYFFATGRKSTVLREALDQLLIYNDLKLLNSVNGEWAVFYYRKDIQKLIFARDIFARKSLCIRINLNKNKEYLLEITSFPGEISDDWYEVFPGTIFVLSFNKNDYETIEFYENHYISGLWNLRLLNLKCDFFKTVKLEAISHFSYEMLIKNSFTTFFSNVKFSFINADHLLKPTSHVLSKQENEYLLDSTAKEFYCLFEASLNNLGVGKLIQNSKIIVLFSGGVDSFLVALTAGNLAQTGIEIILVNVAFGETLKDFSEVPDRQRSINAFNFLKESTKGNKRKCKYRLILVNINKTELAFWRQKIIARAISPAYSVLDDSIGCVLWFASRAKGCEYIDENNKRENINFDNEIKFVLVGSGADEQLGGYARHRIIFNKFGYDRLAEELSMELSRIGLRNFGRDDRIGLSNNRILLSPFLEESFVKWLNKIPLSLKIDYSLPRGYGEKRLLRIVLMQQGVPDELAAQPKSAMQFGSRIAKLENKREKGSDICDRLKSELIIN